MYIPGFNHPDKHNCQKACHSCHDVTCNPPADVAMVKGAICNRYFRGHPCLQKHMVNGTCVQFQCCQDCLLHITAGKDHICGKRRCDYCLELVNHKHLCFMQKPIINAAGRSERKKPETLVAPQNSSKTTIAQTPSFLFRH